MKRKKNIKIVNKAEDLSLKNGNKSLKMGKEKFSIECVKLLKKEMYQGKLETYLHLIKKYLEDAENNHDKSIVRVYEIFLEKFDRNTAIFEANKIVEECIKSRTADLFKLLKKRKTEFNTLHLAYCYECGYGTSKNQKKAFELYLQIAKSGNIEAMVNLGRCYSEGIGINIDYNHMLKWYKNAGSKGNPDAQFILGEIYSQSILFLNLEESYYWYKLAAQQGHKIAQFALAKLILEKNDSIESVKKAERWLFNSLIQGYTEALELYVNIYGEIKILEFPIYILENLYTLFREKLPKGAIKKLYDFYLKKGEKVISLLEKRKWRERAKQLNLGPSENDLMQEYNTLIKSANSYKEINDIFTYIYSWFGLKKSIYENIKITATILIQEVFAYNLISINPIFSYDVFANNYISFYYLKDNDEYKEICFDRDTDINVMSKFWLIQAFKMSNQNIRYELLTDFYENIDNQIIFKYNYNSLFESESNLKNILNINQDDIKKIFADYYLTEAKKFDNSIEAYEFCKKALLITPDETDLEILQYLFELIEKEDDIKIIDSIYTFLTESMSYSNDAIKAFFSKKYAIKARNSRDLYLINLYTNKAFTLDSEVGKKELINYPINLYINRLKSGNIVEEKDELDLLLMNSFNLDYDLARKKFTETYLFHSKYLNDNNLKIIFYMKLINMVSSFNRDKMLDFFSMLIELEDSPLVLCNLIDKMIFLTEPKSNERKHVRLLFCNKFVLLGKKEKDLNLKLEYYKTAEMLGGNGVRYHIIDILNELNTMNITKLEKEYYREKVVDYLNRNLKLKECFE